MDFLWSDEGSEERFAAYVARLSQALGHADRVGPFRSYCTGLLLPGERKSVEPMAARLRPDRTAAEHQSLPQFVGQSPWDETALLRAVRDAVLPAMTAAGPVQGWIVDDTGFPKKGRHSVGVARQYCGQLGKRNNCQVAVSLSVATARASLPVAWRLYLPKSWADDAARRSPAGVPGDVVFRSKPPIALSQIAAALAEGVAPGTVLADAGYGNDCRFRAGISELRLDYVVGVTGTTAVWPPGMEPTVPAWSGRGRRPTRHPQARGVAADRMAGWRSTPDEVLVVDPAARHANRSAGLSCQAALADRARLYRAQTRDRPRPLRGTRLARLPSSCRRVHCHLWIPGGRAGRDSPLGRRRPRAGPSAFPSRRSPTPRRHLLSFPRGASSCWPNQRQPIQLGFTCINTMHPIPIFQQV